MAPGQVYVPTPRGGRASNTSETTPSPSRAAKIQSEAWGQMGGKGIPEV